jgi:hypothetical protein
MLASETTTNLAPRNSQPFKMERPGLTTRRWPDVQPSSVEPFIDAIFWYFVLRLTPPRRNSTIINYALDVAPVNQSINLVAAILSPSLLLLDGGAGLQVRSFFAGKPTCRAPNSLLQFDHEADGRIC